MQSITTFLTLATVATASFQLAPGAADGIYIGSINDAGEHVVTFHGNDPASAGTPFTDFKAVRTEPTIRGRASGLQKRNGVSCEEVTVNSNDLNSAVNQFANTFDNFSFGGRSLTLVSGGAMAFCCNYGGQQTVHRGDYINDQNSVSNQCGFSTGGWYTHNDWALTYGRTAVGRSIC